MRLLILFLLLLAVGCSDRPAPTQPTPTPTPVPASVTVTGTITQTLSGAQVGTFTQTVPSLPALIPVSLAGFVTRQAWVTSATPTVDLIAEAGFDLEFYRQLARGKLDGSLQPLRRWNGNPSIYLQRNGFSDATIASLERVARDVIPAFTGNRLSLQGWETGDATRPEQTGWIVIETYNDMSGDCGRAALGGGHVWINTIPNCVDLGYAATNFGHELGHALGFWHVSSGLMQAPAPRGMTMPSQAERHHAALAYARPVGNTDVDADPRGSARASTRVVVD